MQGGWHHSRPVTGEQVERMEDYAQWYSTFKRALEGLDAKRQQQSPLPIIYQWAKPAPPDAGAKWGPPAPTFACDARWLPHPVSCLKCGQTGTTASLDMFRHTLSPGLPLLRPAALRHRFDATQMRAKARELTPWGDVPHLDKKFIHRNMQHLEALRLIAPPSQA